ncbi:MAG: DUF3667 domain-containing protein [Stenotrophomonas sp.]
MHRIDWHFLGHELEHSVLHMDRGILYSLKQLMLQPGRLLRDYIEGRRGNQVKPLLLITMMAAAVLLLNRLITGTSILDGGASEAMLSGRTLPGEVLQFMAANRAVSAWVESHFAAFTLMLLPIEAFVFRLVFSRYSKLNYPEWLVITTLLTVQAFVIWSVLMAVHRWVPYTQVMAGVLGMAYSVVSLVQFFQARPLWSTMWRSLLALGLFSVISMLAVLAATVVVMRVG